MNLDAEKLLEIIPSVKAKLDEKKIYFTFAYIGSLRCYKHNQLIWIEHAPSEKLGCGGIKFDYPYLIKKGKERIEHFLEKGYI